LEDTIFHQIMDILNDGVYFVDADRRITSWNQGAEKLTGIPKEEILGKLCFQDLLMHIDEGGNKICGEDCILSETLSDGEPRDRELFLEHRNGHRIPVTVSTSALRGKDGSIAGAVEVFSDNSLKMADKRRIDELEQLALLDELTRIGNRRFLEMTLRSKLADTTRYKSKIGIFFLDIDHFKAINDKHGHEIGDKVLKAISKSLMDIIRPMDLFGRWGGEEFIIATSNASRQTVKPIAERFRKLVEDAHVLSPDGEEIRFTVSIGVTLSKPGEDMETLIQRADQLMYRSKEKGRNLVTVG